MAVKAPPKVDHGVDTDQLRVIADRARAILKSLRDSILEPFPRKEAPMISVRRLAKLCGVDRAAINYLCGRGATGKYPIGALVDRKRSMDDDVEPVVGAPEKKARTRMFTLEEAQAFIRVNGAPGFNGASAQRPSGARGHIMAVGNFKGGVGKTTTTVSMAQGFTLKGYRVCMIDLDPQGSASTLMGLIPDAEIELEQTVFPAIAGSEPNLDYAIQNSYWPGLDFIPSCPALFSADFYLPNKQARDPKFEFYKVLNKVLDPLRDRYDIIIIDTPPTLSYLAVAAFNAADSLVVPLPPETLDYASSTAFFAQFSDLFDQLRASRAVHKRYDFIKIVLSRVKNKPQTTANVRDWIKQTYGNLVAASELLDSDVVSNSSAEFKTVYDIENYEGTRKRYDQTIDVFDAVVDELALAVQRAWSDVATQSAEPYGLSDRG